MAGRGTAPGDGRLMRQRATMSAQSPQVRHPARIQRVAVTSRKVGPVLRNRSSMRSDLQAMRSEGAITTFCGSPAAVSMFRICSLSMGATRAVDSARNGRLGVNTSPLRGAAGRTGTTSKTLTKGMLVPTRIKGEQQTSRNLKRQAACLSAKAPKKASKSVLASIWAGETPVSEASRDRMSRIASFTAKAARARRDFGSASMIDDASAVTYMTAASAETASDMAGLYPARHNVLYSASVANSNALAPWRPVNFVNGHFVAAQPTRIGG